jgi:hypothetical protein
MNVDIYMAIWGDKYRLKSLKIRGHFEQKLLESFLQDDTSFKLIP